MANTTTKQGTLTSPGAGAVIAQYLLGTGGAAIASGLYRVTVTCKFLGGTPANPADTDNFELLVDDVSVGQCSSGLALNTDYKTDFLVNASQSLKVRAKGAGTASVVYDALIVATKDG